LNRVIHFSKTELKCWKSAFATTQEISILSIPEIISPVDQLWNEILENPDAVELTNWQKEILEDEYQKYLETPDEGRPWESVKNDILNQLSAVL
jgi:putative addiction module component (TIGR02574 family)